MAFPCLLLAAAPPIGTNALSLTTTTTTTTSPGAATSKSLVDQARLIRELKGGKESRQARGRLSVDAKPLLDSDALSAALFDDDFTKSLDDAVSHLGQKKTGASAKSRAEEFDRFMEEDATVASIVLENIKPGSLVDDVKQNKGADIVDMETLMQREAADRRKNRQAKNSAIVDSDARHALASITAPTKPAVKVTRRKTKSSSKASDASIIKSSSLSREYKVLLTRDQEYALARTIQAGARVHKLKVEYESSNSEPLSKRQWAELAGMPSNELRKLISDYRTAKQELVSSNMGLVHAVVRSYTHKAQYRGVAMEELIQEGSLGLIRAAELLDPDGGVGAEPQPLLR